MQKFSNWLVGLAILIYLTSCHKNSGNESSLATGNLPLDSVGNCQNIAVNGFYTPKTILTSDNYITVTVNFTSNGKYRLYTDTINGCWFTMDTTMNYNDSTKKIKLQGYGTPASAGTYYYTVHFQNSFCSFSLNVDNISASIAEQDYFPMTTGSWWTDDTALNGSSTDTVRYTITGANQVYNGLTYKVFASSKIGDTRYYRKDYNGHYYEYTTQNSELHIAPFDYMFLDDTKPVGYTWQTPTYNGSYESQFLTLRYKFTIIERNPYKPLYSNQTFDSVIHVRQEIIMVLSGLDISNTFAPIDIFYIKKLGMSAYYSPTINNYLTNIKRYIQ